MSDLDRLAQRLRDLRQRHGLTQERFAEIAKLSYKFYQQIEAGRKKQIWLETVGRLVIGFGLETWQLLSPEMPAATVVAGQSEIARPMARTTGKNNLPKKILRQRTKRRRKQN